MRVRVLRQHESWARRGPIFGHQPARLIPHATGIAQCLRAHGPGSPLWGLVRRAMQALAAVTGAPVAAVLLSRCRLRGLLNGGGSRKGGGWNDEFGGVRRRRRWGQDKEA